MSGTDTDPVTCVVLGFMALVGLLVILPLIVAYSGLMFAGRTLIHLGERRGLLLDPAVREEHQRIAIERSTAIRDIVAIRQRSEREMRALADGHGDRA